MSQASASHSRAAGALLSSTWRSYRAVLPVVALPFALLRLSAELCVLPFDDKSRELVGTFIALPLLPLGAAATLVAHRRMRAGEALLAAYKRFGELFFASFMVSLSVLVSLLLFIVPGVVRMLSCALVVPILILEHADTHTAIAQSRARMNGHRVALLLAGAVVVGVTCLLPLVGQFGPELLFGRQPGTAGDALSLLLAPLEELGFELPLTMLVYAAYERRQASPAQDTAAP